MDLPHPAKPPREVGSTRPGMPLRVLERQLGHKHLEVTMKYATVHPGYNDAALHFEKMGRMPGLRAPEGREGRAMERIPGDDPGDTPQHDDEPAAAEKG